MNTRTNADGKKTVAHVMRGFLSPTETFIANQIRTLKRYRPVVLCHHNTAKQNPDINPVYPAEELISSWLRPGDAFFYRLARALFPPSARQLVRQMEKEQAGLLHFHYLVDARFFLTLKRMTGLPALVSAYGYDVSYFPRKFFGLGLAYLRPIFEDMDCFLAMSHDMKKNLIRIGCPENRILVHYYGTDTDRFAYPDRSYPDKSCPEILMCGTLEPKKAQDRVMTALHRWEKEQGTGSAFHLTLMGDGPLRPKLQEMVKEYGWEDRVRFLGHVPYNDQKLLEEYRKADIFTLPSITLKSDKEGIPGTVVEAMACGLPVVSTYHTGIPEVITDGQDGLLVRENDLQGLSKALGSLIKDRGLRERLGRVAAKTAATKGRLLSRTPVLEAVYDHLLAGKSPSEIRTAVPGL